MTEEVGGADYRDVDIVAKFLNITPRRVQQLASDGVIPKGQRGKYHLVGAIRGYIKFLQERAEGRSAENPALHDERTRLARLQSEEIELRLAEKRGQVVNLTQLEPELMQMIAAFKTDLVARDDRLKSELDALYGIEVDLSLLEDHTRATLAQLARYDPERANAAASTGGVIDADAKDDDHAVGMRAASDVSEVDGEARHL